MFFGWKVWEVDFMEEWLWLNFDFDFFVSYFTMLFDEGINVFILAKENVVKMFELLYFYLA